MTASRLSKLFLALCLGFGLTAQDPGPYLAQQPTAKLPERPYKNPAGSPQDKLAQEERDARFLMDLQVQNQVRSAQSAETVRQNQEKASAALLEYYTRLLEPDRNGGVDPLADPSSQIALQSPTFLAASRGQQAAVRAGQQAQVPAQAPAEITVAEDAPAVARQRGLGFVAKGTIIDIRLYTRVNSSIPGPCVGEVVYDVWDQDQRYIVIPRGSKVTGLSSQMGGDTEVGGKVVFDTFIDPTGREIAIAIPVVTANRVGVMGIPGSIDYHWGRIFGGSAALAVITAMTSGNQPAGYNSQMTQQDMMRQNMMAQAGQVGNQYMQRFINTKPDITLEEGSIAKVIILQHMMVKPYQRVF